MRAKSTVIAVLVAVSMGCAAKKDSKVTGSCIGDPKFAQVKITIDHDAGNAPTDIKDVPTATVYMKPQNVNQPEQVCWIIDPVKSNAPTNQLYKTLSIVSKNGTMAFHDWTTKKKTAGGTLYMASGLPIQKNDMWEYTVKCGGIDLDPVIIIIDESH